MKNYSGIHAMIDAYAKANKCTKKEAEVSVRNTIAVLKQVLLDSDDGIQLIDFITLRKIERKARVGRNPLNPEVQYTIPAFIGIKAELGKAFEEELNS